MINQFTILDETRESVVNNLKMMVNSLEWNYDMYLIVLGQLDVLNYIAKKNDFFFFLKTADLFSCNQKIILELYNYDDIFGIPIDKYIIVGDDNE